ncbi:DUF4221 family protein [Penaeicola halotolerans]|uniref:DUF4221 family protein n=1 Tax=Penaeicola halotolerans TaxID=2793196 RepID=UPI001CF8B4E7|nr:DUF4221 family protein [Penaeicola halotolerans]
MKSQLALLLFTAIILFSCQNVEKKTLANNYEFVLQKSHRIEIDTMTSRILEITGYDKHKNEFFLYNKLNHSIYFYSLDSNKQTKKIQLEADGPNAIIEVRGIDNIAENRFIIFNGRKETFHEMLVKEDTVLFTRHTLQNGNDIETIPETNKGAKNSHLVGNTLYMVTRPLSALNNSNNFLIISYDFDTKETKYLYEYPQDIVENQHNFRAGSKSVFFDDKIVVSFPFKKSIYTFSLVKNEVEEKELSSEKAQPYKILENPNQSHAVAIRNMFSQSEYKIFYYDPQSKTYLRHLFTGIRLPEDDAKIGFSIRYKDYKTINNDENYYVTLFADESMNKIAFINDYYLSENIFSSEEGVFLPNYKDENKNEDIIILNNYRIIKK